MRRPDSIIAQGRLRATEWRSLRDPPPAWLVLLAAVPLLAGSYLLLPPTGIARIVAYPVSGLLAMATVLVACQWWRPARIGS